MTDLADAYDRDVPWQAVAWAVLAFGAGLVAAVGVAAATASLVAGFGVGKSRALGLGVVAGGALLLAAFLAPVVRGAATDRSQLLAGVGAVVGGVGLAWFWTGLPAGWTGQVGTLPVGGAGAYAVGLLAAFGAGFAALQAPDARESAADRREADAFASVGSVLAACEDDPSESATVGDGGEPDEDLSFFDDET
ncbi:MULTISPECIES: hypothetical protein [Halorussus]|uniref:DUF7139 domain-containing protein n=1 Tax=Halorussus TaxID=1070314 RepID=UPI000E217DCC|nr:MULTISPECIES: hypothetical protein [Halorussus]NHN59069.1 hypothetical protein [Halorussus sp. JP-T4]